jgi:hypothetical protein
VSRLLSAPWLSTASVTQTCPHANRLSTSRYSLSLLRIRANAFLTPACSARLLIASWRCDCLLAISRSYLIVPHSLSNLSWPHVVNGQNDRIVCTSNTSCKLSLCCPVQNVIQVCQATSVQLPSSSTHPDAAIRAGLLPHGMVMTCFTVWQMTPNFAKGRRENCLIAYGCEISLHMQLQHD